jgi:transposase
VAERRVLWRFWQAHLHPEQVVFIDETGAHTKLARLYGRALRGQRLVAKIPHGHWKTTTFVGALRVGGITAPLVVDGPMNGTVFRAYVEQQLIAALRPGDTVIMDNLAAHKVAGVREAIEAAGARLVYLPPYSPDLNPIELAFAKLKALLRSAAARTVDQLEETIVRCLDKFTTNECSHYFRHCGYSAR